MIVQAENDFKNFEIIFFSVAPISEHPVLDNLCQGDRFANPQGSMSKKSPSPTQVAVVRARIVK